MTLCSSLCWNSPTTTYPHSQISLISPLTQETETQKKGERKASFAVFSTLFTHRHHFLRPTNISPFTLFQALRRALKADESHTNHGLPSSPLSSPSNPLNVHLLSTPWTTSSYTAVTEIHSHPNRITFSHPTRVSVHIATPQPINHPLFLSRFVFPATNSPSIHRPQQPKAFNNTAVVASFFRDSPHDCRRVAHRTIVSLILFHPRINDDELKLSCNIY